MEDDTRVGGGAINADMSVVDANSKRYELISVKGDPLYDQLKKSIGIVKEFIIKNKLVVYGGTAIDYALRLKGDFIYPDDLLAVPDLDVFSPDSVAHAYLLADQLYNAGYRETRAIRATYVRTMRVDIGDKHWAADITYVPQVIFDQLPYVEYEGMRVLHPDFQRIDLHSSLSFPFDNPPREVIFDRWRKDITRFNKLHTAYPIVPAKNPDLSILKEVTISKDYSKMVFHGFAAYGLLFRALCDLVTKNGVDKAIMNDVLRVPFVITADRIKFSSPMGKIELVHFDPSEAVHTLRLSNIHKYASVLDKVPKRQIAHNATSNNVKVIVYSSSHRLLCIAPVPIAETRFKCVGVQYLLYYFMSMAYNHEYVDGKDAGLRDLYLAFYNSTLKMIAIAEKILSSQVATMEDDALNKCIWLPNVYTYGNDNINESAEAGLQAIKTMLGESVDSAPLPINYYPARGRAPPTFDYGSSSAFIKDGRELTD